MNEIISKIAQIILDNIFPKMCEVCGAGGSYLCESCVKEKISFVEKYHCHVCKKILNIDRQQIREAGRFVHKKCQSRTSLDGVFIVAEYSKLIEDFLGDIKYEFYFAMIDDLVRIMFNYLNKNKLFLDVLQSSILTYVPLHPRRKRWRGFNQAEKMTKILSDRFGHRHKKYLVRNKHTKTQVGLSRIERLNNLDRAFIFNSEVEINEEEKDSVIVVDDVMTSGATLEECGSVLKRSGFYKVYGLVFARG